MSQTPTEVAIEVCNKCTAPSTREQSLKRIVDGLSDEELYETLVLADAEGHERLIIATDRELRSRGREDLLPFTRRRVESGDETYRTDS